ncbi:ankyrin repeat protein [Moumouvirus australiensis]|uniref:Ankyrin repeat protein n=1 Tax=Moumouvirus australiensis TaxID=2109587 RepID=A0A2P1EKR1_9VIRU|nr:ankyrin repeat protein [Moumouvirus australiensis]AVL94473.1 ankyrin repeat protein [Moumouvirus australiensis]
MSSQDYLNPVEKLFEASNNGDINTIKNLTHSNKFSDYIYDQCMIISSKNGYLGIIKYFASIGINIYFDNNKIYRSAIKNGHLNIVKYLVENGLNIDLQDDNSIYISVKNNHLSVVKYLVENNYKSESFDKLYYIAYYFKNKDIVEYFNSINICPKTDFYLEYYVQSLFGRPITSKRLYKYHRSKNIDNINVERMKRVKELLNTQHI